MRANKWTPGPWCVDDDRAPHKQRSSGTLMVVSVNGGMPGIIINQGPILARDEANARLIAAAPELVDELVMSERVMDEVCTMLRDRGDSAHAAELAERIRASRALLARIKGEA